MSRILELKGLSEAVASGQVEAVVAAFRKFDSASEGCIAASRLEEVLEILGLADELAAARASEFCKGEVINYEDFAKWLCGSAPAASRVRGCLAGVCWPPGTSVTLTPAVTKPAEGLKLGGPTPCTGGDRVQYWQVGGPDKARVRVLTDENSDLKLGADFTVGVRFRAGELVGSSYETLLLGHDSKHWLAVECSSRRLCCADGKSQTTCLLKNFEVPKDQWVVVFLQSRGDDTVVFTPDAEGLLRVGVFDMCLAKSKLDKMGWSESEMHLADVSIWPKALSWSEMASAVPRPPPPPPPSLPRQPRPRSAFRGQVVDPSGKAVPDVKVKWAKKSATTDEEGCFEGCLSDVESDAETDVPEDDAGSLRSGGSTSSSCTVLSFSSQGFAPATARTQVTAGGPEALVRVTIRPVSASAVLDLSLGGSVVDEATGSSITVPPGSLTYPDGSPVEGPVTVSLSVIDVTDPAALSSMPGDFSAVGADGQEVFLQSLGACWVGAEDDEGRPLQVKEDSEGLGLDLKSNATADMAKLETSAEMWTFDEESGKWELETETPMKVDGMVAPNAAYNQARPASRPVGYKKKGKSRAKGLKQRNYRREEDEGPEEGCLSEEGFREMIAKEGKKTLSTNITKLGYINCDLAYHHPQRAVMMQGVVLDAKGAPLPGMQLWSVGKDYNGRCPAVSKDGGKFGAMIAQFDSSVDVEVHARREVEGDEKLSVYFKDYNDWLKHADKDTKKVMEAVAGKYKKGSGKELAYHPDSEKKAVQASVVSWLAARRQWQHKVDGNVVFVREAESEEGGPFAESGWQMSASFAAKIKQPIPAPIYGRPTVVDVTTFGPFKTGPPGEFVDVGELVLK